jgi:hypothetical protein
MPNDSVVQLTARLLDPKVCSQIIAGTLPSSDIAYHVALLVSDADALSYSARRSLGVGRVMDR